MTLQCPVDHITLARQTLIVDAGAAARPARATAAEQGRRDRRRRRGIADAHLAQADEIALRRDRLVSGRHSGEEFLLAQRRLFGEVGGRPVEFERNDPQACAGRARELIDRGAACGEIRHHLRRDLGRIGGDAAPRHAVTAGKDQNIDALQPRRHMALPMGEPGDQVLEPAEALRRLGQAGFALRDRRARRRMPARQVKTSGAQRRKRGKIRHRRSDPWQRERPVNVYQTRGTAAIRIRAEDDP